MIIIEIQRSGDLVALGEALPSTLGKRGYLADGTLFYT